MSKSDESTDKSAGKFVAVKKEVSDSKSSPKGLIKEGYQPTDKLDTTTPPKQNPSEKKG